MNTLTQKLVALSLVTMSAVAPTLSHAETAAKVVPDYTVFLDPPTGFVFVKLPAGWKFVGKVDVKDLANLPDGVVTALLTGSEDADDASLLALRPKK